MGGAAGYHSGQEHTRLPESMKRVRFLRIASFGITGLLVPGGFSQAAGTPKIKPALVKEFVAAGHNNLRRVKEMLASHPNLIFASYDWGGGDFEEALEGAGHVGNKEIANFLIEQGARPTPFVLCMLGNTQLIKNIITTYPGLLNAKGPHGFTLLHHAKVGEASELIVYLEEQGLKETILKI